MQGKQLQLLHATAMHAHSVSSILYCVNLYTVVLTANNDLVIHVRQPKRYIGYRTDDGLLISY
jgi:hypothetical protein